MKFLYGMLMGMVSSTGILYLQKHIYHTDQDFDQENSISYQINLKDIYPKEPELSKRHAKILNDGQPFGGLIIRKLNNHILGYDCSKKIPYWVLEHLSEEILQGDANRKNVNFTNDPEIPMEFSAQNSDYSRSGWSRGHMAPAANNKLSLQAMKDTFYLSNILPQDIDNNGGFWNRLEIYARDLAYRFSDVWITSGPLFLPVVNEKGKKMVTYQVIGENEVAVPTHIYKIILAKRENETVMGSFIVPNKPIDYSHELKEFQVPLETVEKKTGFKFYPQRNYETVGDLCKVDGCELMGKTEMDQFIYSKRLKNATNIHKLEKVWKEIQDKGIPISNKMNKIYTCQQNSLDSKESETTIEEQKYARRTSG